MKPASLEVRWVPSETPYTGVELRPHYLLQQHQIWGSGLLAFLGPCHVPTENLVDWEDRIQEDFIQARRMLHFIGEFFGISLPEAVCFQRLLMATAAELLNQKLKATRITRIGDDLFFENRKLSVSIVTASAVSTLLHVGINVDFEGAPVPAIGLRELNIDPRAFAHELLERISGEWKSIARAQVKVKPVV